MEPMRFASKIPMLSANKANESTWIVSLTSVSIVTSALRPGADPEKLQGEGHESQWDPTYIYPKSKISTDFGHFISVVPYFQFFFFQT